MNTVFESDGVRLIAAERQRQIVQEGLTPEHDDVHFARELAEAAVAYIRYGFHPRYPCGSPPGCWPWEAEWWKPTSEIGGLVKAGALIAAEIDRLTRKAAV